MFEHIVGCSPPRKISDLPPTKFSNCLFFSLFTDLKSCPIYPKCSTKIGIFWVQFFGFEGLEGVWVGLCKDLELSSTKKKWKLSNLSNSFHSQSQDRWESSFTSKKSNKSAGGHLNGGIIIYLPISLSIALSFYLSISLFFSPFSLSLISQFNWPIKKLEKCVGQR